MKKILFVIAAFLVSMAAADAQDLKFGYVNYDEIVMLMAETDSARPRKMPTKLSRQWSRSTT